MPNASWVFSLPPTSVAIPPLPIAPGFVLGRERAQKRAYDSSVLVAPNRLTNIPIETIHSFFDTQPEYKPGYVASVSFIRGQAGAAGATPPNTEPLPFQFQKVLFYSPYYQPGSDFIEIPIPLRAEYDPFGGGAFLNTAPPGRLSKIRIDISGIFRSPQIILPDAGLPLRRFTIPHFTRPAHYSGSAAANMFRVRHVPNPVAIANELQTFTLGSPRARLMGPAYPVNASWVTMTATSDITARVFGYDIYHYYV